MMQKYIVGAFFGFILAFTISAHAEVKNMINKVVEGTFPVTVDGKKLEADAVVIEGSTYLPVRAFGEAIGYKVGFDANLGVNLTKTVTESTYTQPTVTDDKTQKINELRRQQNILQKQIEDLYPIVRPYEIIVLDPDKGLGTKEKDDIYYKTKKIREEAAVKRDQIEQQIKELSK